MSQLVTNDVVSICDFFKDLSDPRSAVNRKHLLGDLIVICVCGVIAGADGPRAIGMWADSNADWLRQHLALPNGIPSHDTVGRLLATLKPSAFQSCFEKWIQSLRNDDTSNDEVIAIDGKALRRSHDRKNNLGALFLVSAWSVQNGISLGQLATEEKSNEITAIPDLLDKIDVNKAIVTIDAAGCQTNIAAKIIDGGGDYVLALKGNQKKTHKDVLSWVLPHVENDFADVTMRKHEEIVEGHGRVDRLIYYQILVPDELPTRNRWKDLRTIGVAIRLSSKEGKVTQDARFFLSSLPLGVKRFANAVRGHWAIENTLHWCLDVTFREDESRLRNRFAADNIAWLKRFAISLLKQQKDKESVAMRRRMAGWNTKYLAQVLGIPTV